jgi:hypothetical protein
MVDYNHLDLLTKEELSKEAARIRCTKGKKKAAGKSLQAMEELQKLLATERARRKDRNFFRPCNELKDGDFNEQDFKVGEFKDGDFKVGDFQNMDNDDADEDFTSRPSQEYIDQKRFFIQDLNIIVKNFKIDSAELFTDLQIIQDDKQDFAWKAHLNITKSSADVNAWILEDSARCLHQLITPTKNMLSEAKLSAHRRRFESVFEKLGALPFSDDDYYKIELPSSGGQEAATDSVDVANDKLVLLQGRFEAILASIDKKFPQHKTFLQEQGGDKKPIEAVEDFKSNVIQLSKFPSIRLHKRGMDGFKAKLLQGSQPRPQMKKDGDAEAFFLKLHKATLLDEKLAFPVDGNFDPLWMNIQSWLKFICVGDVSKLRFINYVHLKKFEVSFYDGGPVHQQEDTFSMEYIGSFFIGIPAPYIALISSNVFADKLMGALMQQEGSCMMEESTTSTNTDTSTATQKQIYTKSYTKTAVRRRVENLADGSKLTETERAVESNVFSQKQVLEMKTSQISKKIMKLNDEWNVAKNSYEEAKKSKNGWLRNLGKRARQIPFHQITNHLDKQIVELEKEKSHCDEQLAGVDVRVSFQKMIEIRRNFFKICEDEIKPLNFNGSKYVISDVVTLNMFLSVCNNNSTKNLVVNNTMTLHNGSTVSLKKDWHRTLREKNENLLDISTGKMVIFHGIHDSHFQNAFFSDSVETNRNNDEFDEVHEKRRKISNELLNLKKKREKLLSSSGENEKKDEIAELMRKFPIKRPKY